MKVEFLGTGGAMSIPRPLCNCQVCKQAREKGVPYSRSGPSLFLHGPNLLFDTPEDIYFEVNRSQIKEISGVFYSHWHPDHVMGRRVLEALNADWVNYPPKNTQSEVFIPEQVALDFKHFLGTGDHLDFLKQNGLIKIKELNDGQSANINNFEVKPFRLEEEYMYGFLVEGANNKILIIMDELNNWEPSRELDDLDLAVLPIGIFEYHPLTGERLISQEHPVLKEEATFLETIEIIKKLNPKKTLFTHIEEMNGLGFDELKIVEEKLKAEGLNIEIAYDTLMVEI
ncbi:MBL fold metallo-hydrolase [Metabacillus halosaccharovorans]|uniref:MBL fold metallo-hydrolase n=1 Tax=Metabacillus halosaccharovorans TaxID=930124 RepID=UPI001C1FBD45|nr:MBL fold metallo-hydrolase [Metabacillus halosaccharovorans]MBU7595691.1 hypothetical protein [Metabacillus halosaccharovorans]